MERRLIIAVVSPFLLDKFVVAPANFEKFPGVTVADAEGFENCWRTMRQCEILKSRIRLTEVINLRERTDCSEIKVIEDSGS